jgi:hypothetical protein
LSVIPEGIPFELRVKHQWVVWRYDLRDGKWTKPPYDAKSGKLASSTDPATWSTFEQALAAYKAGGWDGVGFVPTPEDGLGITDLDHMRDRETGILTPRARSIVTRLDTYAEASPSGTGVRSVAYGRKPDRERSKNGDVEIYDGLTAEGKPGGRYLTFTGHRLEGAPADIRQRQEALAAVYEAEVKGATKPAKPTKPAPGNNGHLDDEEVIRRAAAADNGDKFTALWAGGTDLHDGDESRADAALVAILAFWTRRDAAQMDRLFRRSGLMRPKWDDARGEKTYGRRTIDFAISQCAEVYEPSTRHNGRDDSRQPAEKKATSPSFQVGMLTLRPERTRRTASGTVKVDVVVVVDGKRVDLVTLSSSTTGRREAARQIAKHLPADSPDRDRIDMAVAGVLASADEQLKRPAVSDPDAKTLYEVVREAVPKMLGVAGRTEKGVWSEHQGGELNRQSFVTFTPPWLLEAAAAASDAPRDETGQVKRPVLLRAIKTELEILWSELVGTLPLWTDAELGSETAAGRKFHEAMVRLWTAPRTFEVAKTLTGTSGEVTASRASLISRVQHAARPYLGPSPTATPIPRETWREIQSSFAAYWRPYVVPGEGTIGILLAMRWSLGGQIGVELPGVTSPETLKNLGVKFGCVQEHPPVSGILSGGTARLSVLSRAITEELLEVPQDEEQPNPDSEPVTAPLVTESADGSGSVDFPASDTPGVVTESPRADEHV